MGDAVLEAPVVEGGGGELADGGVHAVLRVQEDRPHPLAGGTASVLLQYYCSDTTELQQ